MSREDVDNYSLTIIECLAQREREGGCLACWVCLHNLSGEIEQHNIFPYHILLHIVKLFLEL